MTQQTVPTVLVFAGSDPTGGAGIQADIESIASMGGHAAPIITALTVQDTETVRSFETVEPALIEQQARTLLADMPIAAIKLGMLSSREVAEVVHNILKDYRDVPVVVDPVLAAGGGTELAGDALRQAYSELILPLATLTTPNSEEARKLTSTADTLDACAHELMDLGCQSVLITGTHEGTPDVHNTFYEGNQRREEFTWDRLPHTYHGSGCTLASASAALLAHGLDAFTAINEAQEYTWQALNHAYQLGRAQYHPNRFFWAREV